MNTRILIAAVAVSSLFGYLEWGTSESSFLWEGEWEVLKQLFTDPARAVHPFTLIPLAGQMLLLVTLFRKKPNKWLSLTGIAGIGVLLLFMLFVGILAMNWKIIISIIPFLLFAILALRSVFRKPVEAELNRG